MHDQCVRAAHENHGSVSVRFLDPVQYGEPFLEHFAVTTPFCFPLCRQNNQGSCSMPFPRLFR